ncbi:LuxR family transcriptional regulator [Longispora albida]|uniref:LuxR family transcriptional regulator n=1 Tax=Longispora albida TaxID=203523 RepID=UPI00037B708C|nr:LuxR family transcriptional regulator [Longispora albida]
MREPAQLAGRERETTALRAAIARLATGQPGLVTVTGDPGIGKTRLLGVLRAEAAAAGVTVLSGRASELGRDLAFGPVVMALGDLAEACAGRFGEATAGLLAGVFPGLAAAPAGVGALDRYRIYRAVRGLLAEVTPAGGAVLVLDDVHWADEGTVELVAYLLSHPLPAPLLIALAYRPRQAPARLLAALARVTTDLGTEHIELAPLSPLEAGALVPGQLTRLRRDALYEASGGNPFYLTTLAAMARYEPAPGAGDMPAAVRGALLAEAQLLSPQALGMARCAAVIGDQIRPALLTTLTGLPAAGAASALQELLDADLLRTEGPALVFRHPLVRQVIYDTAPATSTMEQHAALARLLAEQGAPAALRAPHVTRSAVPGDTGAADVLLQAALAIMDTVPATAAHWLDAALGLLPAGDPSAARLILLRARALAFSGQLHQAHDLVLRLLGGGDVPGAVRLEAATLYSLVQRLLGRHEAAHAVLAAEAQRHDAEAGPSPAGLWLELARCCFQLADIPGVYHWSGLVRATAQSTGDVALGLATDALMVIGASYAGDLPTARAVLDRAAAALDQLTDQQVSDRLEGLVWLAWAEQVLERPHDAQRHLGRGLRLSRSSGQIHYLADLLTFQASVSYWRGQLGEAGAHADDAAELAELLDSDELRLHALVVLCEVAFARGEPAPLRDLAARIEALTSGGRSVDRLARGVAASARVFAGEPATGLAMLVDAGGPDLAGLPGGAGPAWLWIAVEASLALGRPAEATYFAEHAAKRAAAIGLPGQQGFALLSQGRVHQVAGEHAEALSTLEEAAASFTTAGMAHFAARAQLEAARVLTALGRHEAALTALASASALAAPSGPTALLRSIRQEQRRTGPRGRRSTTALSEREQRIAELVAAGHSNRAIAEALFLSPKTVETHLTRVFAKLSITSRAAVGSALSGCTG